MKIACVIAAERLEEAVRLVHDEFFSQSEVAQTSDARV
jgi:aspartokinase